MACDVPDGRVIGSTEFFERLALSANPDSDFPLAGSIELTMRCNLRCPHCYTRYPGAADGEMDFARVTQVLDRLCDSGVLFLLMTGGEILLRPDFPDIYRYAKTQGLLVSLFTNGTLVDAAMAGLLADLPPRRIEITVYGHTRETYEAVTGVTGSFDRFRKGLALLLERHLPVSLKMMVLRGNEHEFDQVRAWVEGQGIAFRHDAVVCPRLDGDPAPARERLPAEQVARLAGADAAQRADWDRLREADRQTTPPDRRLFRCGAGLRTFHIDARGLMHPCSLWRVTPYDPLTGSLRGGWQEHVRRIRTATLPDDSACLLCENRIHCTCCTAVSRLEHGVAGKESPYYCAIVSAREKALHA